MITQKTIENVEFVAAFEEEIAKDQAARQLQNGPSVGEITMRRIAGANEQIVVGLRIEDGSHLQSPRHLSMQLLGRNPNTDRTIKEKLAREKLEDESVRRSVLEGQIGYIVMAKSPQVVARFYGAARAAVKARHAAKADTESVEGIVVKPAVMRSSRKVRKPRAARPSQQSAALVTAESLLQHSGAA